MIKYINRFRLLHKLSKTEQSNVYKFIGAVALPEKSYEKQFISVNQNLLYLYIFHNLKNNTLYLCQNKKQAILIELGSSYPDYFKYWKVSFTLIYIVK